MRIMGFLGSMLVSVGVIGGADGPTAILVTAGEGWWILPLVVLAAIAAGVGLIVRKARKRRGK